MNTTSFGKLLAISPNPAIEMTAIVAGSKPEDIHHPNQMLTLPGGQGIALARAFKALGGDSSICLLISGERGRWIVDGLKREGLNVAYHITNGETPIHYYNSDPNSQQIAEVNHSAQTIHTEDWRAYLAVIEKAFDENILVTINGNLPMGAPADGFHQIIKSAHAKSIPVVLNISTPNLSSTLATNPWGIRLSQPFGSQLEDLKSNLPETILSMATSYLDIGGEWIVIDNHNQGVYLVTHDHAWRALLTSIMNSSYSSGNEDVMLAGFLYSLMRKESYTQSLGFALAAAAANACQPGAGVLSTDAVVKFRPSVFIQQLR